MSPALLTHRRRQSPGGSSSSSPCAHGRTSRLRSSRTPTFVCENGGRLGTESGAMGRGGRGVAKQGWHLWSQPKSALQPHEDFDVPQVFRVVEGMTRSGTTKSPRPLCAAWRRASVRHRATSPRPIGAAGTRQEACPLLVLRAEACPPLATRQPHPPLQLGQHSQCLGQGGLVARRDVLVGVVCQVLKVAIVFGRGARMEDPNHNL